MQKEKTGSPVEDQQLANGSILSHTPMMQRCVSLARAAPKVETYAETHAKKARKA
jgi:hypothetical protein